MFNLLLCSTLMVEQRLVTSRPVLERCGTLAVQPVSCCSSPELAFTELTSALGIIVLSFCLVMKIRDDHDTKTKLIILAHVILNTKFSYFSFPT